MAGFLRDLLEMVETGRHLDGRVLGPRLRPRLIMIIAFLQFGTATGRLPS